MSEVIDTSMTAVLKRTASTDTLAENSKRKDTTEKAERVLYPDVDPVNDPCVIAFLYGEKGMGILSSKVENHSQLKEKAKVLFVSLQNVVGNGGQLATVAVQVKNLFESRAFIQMFADAYMKAPRLLFYVEIFSNEANDQERLENLKKDTWLESILQETKTTAIISGALTIALGFWSNNYFYLKLREAVIDAKRKFAKPIKDFVEKEDRIVNLNVSSIEGLKKALKTFYNEDKCKHMVEEIDRDISSFERMFSLGAGQQVTWLSILWRDESFSVRAVGYGEPPSMPPYDSNK